MFDSMKNIIEQQQEIIKKLQEQKNIITSLGKWQKLSFTKYLISIFAVVLAVYLNLNFILFKSLIDVCRVCYL